MATRTSDVRPRRPAVPVAAPRGSDVGARLAAAAPGVARPRRRLLGDPRGLTAAGGAALVVLVCLPALAVDLLLGGGPGALSAVAFPLGCALAALTVHREDLPAVVVMPPLLHLAFALLAATPGGGPGGWAERAAAGLADALVYRAPLLWAATGAAAAVAVWRRRAGGGR